MRFPNAGDETFGRSQKQSYVPVMLTLKTC